MDQNLSYLIDTVLKNNYFHKEISERLNDCIRLLVKERNQNTLLKRRYFSLAKFATSNSNASCSSYYVVPAPFRIEPPFVRLLASDSELDENNPKKQVT